MDEKALLQRFNLRCLLVAGMLLGGMPFIMTPLVMRGMTDGYPTAVAAIFNGLTVLPASALAFWYRRVSCVWLSLNAVVLVTGLVTSGRLGWQDHLVALLGACGSISLAICLDFMEIRGWPGALSRG